MLGSQGLSSDEQDIERKPGIPFLFTGLASGPSAIVLQPLSITPIPRSEIKA